MSCRNQVLLRIGWIFGLPMNPNPVLKAPAAMQLPFQPGLFTINPKTSNPSLHGVTDK
jgi:hypothetical protein